MNSLRFYYDHSLLGHFCRRAKHELRHRRERKLRDPAWCETHGIKLGLEGLHPDMVAVLRSGSYERSEVEIVSRLVHAQDRVLELGGAIGAVALFCRKVLGVTELVSVEPNPATAERLEENFEANGFRPHIIRAALSEHDGLVKLAHTDMFWEDSIITEHGTERTTIEVQGLTLESLGKLVPFEYNTLIVDVEGAEVYLRPESIPAAVRKLLIEMHPKVIGPQRCFRLVEDLILAGFRIECVVADCWAFLRGYSIDD